MRRVTTSCWLWKTVDVGTTSLALLRTVTSEELDISCQIERFNAESSHIYNLYSIQCTHRQCVTRSMHFICFLGNSKLLVSNTKKNIFTSKTHLIWEWWKWNMTGCILYCSHKIYMVEEPCTPETTYMSNIFFWCSYSFTIPHLWSKVEQKAVVSHKTSIKPNQTFPFKHLAFAELLVCSVTPLCSLLDGVEYKAG